MNSKLGDSSFWFMVCPSVSPHISSGRSFLTFKVSHPGYICPPRNKYSKTVKYALIIGRDVGKINVLWRLTTKLSSLDSNIDT